MKQKRIRGLIWIDGNFRVHLEAQSNPPAFNLDHRDLEHALEANGPAHHDRFLAFSGQDQHR